MPARRISRFRRDRRSARRSVKAWRVEAAARTLAAASASAASAAFAAARLRSEWPRRHRVARPHRSAPAVRCVRHSAVQLHCRHRQACLAGDIFGKTRLLGCHPFQGFGKARLFTIQFIPPDGQTLNSAARVTDFAERGKYSGLCAQRRTFCCFFSAISGGQTGRFSVSSEVASAASHVPAGHQKLCLSLANAVGN